MDEQKNKHVIPEGNENRETVGYDHKEVKTAILWPCHQGPEPLYLYSGEVH